MKKEYTLDRVEGDIAVCVLRADGTVTEFPASKILEAGVAEGGIFTADVQENEILSVEYMARKTESVKEDARSRLAALFNRRKGDNE